MQPLPDVSAGGHQGPTKHVVLEGFSHALAAAIGWWRAGYPDEAPRTGYSPLLALNGPLALTLAQRGRIVEDLDYQASDTAIDVAIIKTTNHPPTPTQTRAVSQLLHHRASQQ